MRIAISGSHGTGKSTLIEALSSQLRKYEAIPEPYYDLVDEGRTFEYPPSLEDYEIQLERSIKNLGVVTSAEALFDRCPVDYLAYLGSCGAEGRESIANFFAAAAEALSSLDFVVLVPIESPDLIHLEESETQRLRRRTDLQLRGILIDDVWGLGLDVIEVRGTVQDRVSQVIARLNAPVAAA